MPRGTTAFIAAALAWVGLVPFVVVAITKPDSNETGCLDVCLAPPEWLVVDGLLTPVILALGLFGAVSAYITRRRDPTSLALAAWRLSLGALGAVVVTWVALAAFGD